MWRSRTDRDRNRVVYITCGDAVLRSAAREYDKEGNRQKRRGKRFEHLCKSCYRGLYHQPREELEGLPDDIEEHGISDEEFLPRYFDMVKERYESLNERGR